MTCPDCGAPNDEQAVFCASCGHKLKNADTAAAKPEQPGAETGAFTAEPYYAGFWRRFLAVCIDELILGAVTLLFSTSYLYLVAGGPGAKTLGVTVMSNRIFNFLLHWLYFTLTESSALQATLGKTAIGIVVTDYDGKRISLLRANARYFGKFISALLFGIGFIMAGFTRKKQALHDMLASTLVIKK